MNRKKFLQLTSLTSIGLLLGLDAFGSSSASGSIISIGEPTIHGRHGLFNLTNSSAEKGIIIQRDILTRDGIDLLSNDRITTLRISNGEQDIFHILDNNISNLQKEQLTIIKLNTNEPYSLTPLAGKSIIFSECSGFKMNNKSFKNSEGYLLSSTTKQVITSEEEQFILIYNV